MKTGISMVELNHKRKVKAANQRKLIKEYEAKIINQREIIKGLQSKNEWISVEDSLPEYHEAFLCTGGIIDMEIVSFCPDFGWADYGEEITHWMLLPKTPAEIQAQRIIENR